ncbi:MAG: hypothetical protein VXX36_01560 [Verrucomicrobiota bacterium]|nr:hypothetical protein [Verrucomicrobiota bacterium]
MQLFDLANDIGEQNDLSEERPELVVKLKQQLHDWRKAVDAKMPYPKTATSKPAPGARVANPPASSASGQGAVIVSEDLPKSVVMFAPGWEVRDWGGPAMKPGLREAWGGRRAVLLTHPKSKEEPCTLSKTVSVPEGKTTTLKLEVNNHPKGDWLLAVCINGKEILKKIVGKQTWQPVELDLSDYGGKTIRIDLENRLNDTWKFEAGYWSDLEIVSE